jgi:hypothetical protein
MQQKQSLLNNIEAVVAGPNPHPLSAECLAAVRSGNINKLAELKTRLDGLNKDRQRLAELDSFLSKTLRPQLPNLTNDLTTTYDDLQWEIKLSHFQAAWSWSQARHWIEDYIGGEDATILEQRLSQVRDEILKAIGDLAESLAWKHFCERCTEDHRQHLVGFQQAMQKYGKGTGKFAHVHRRTSQKHLEDCREAIPAWIMPLNRVWDAISPEAEMFDVVIVDEASQCGLEAVALLYLGKQVLIVGDDKQISPQVIGVDKQVVQNLQAKHLNGFLHRDAFQDDSSMFAIGQRFFPDSVTLREHFRCMPEIIRFSDELCYTATPLIPLRQFGKDRLEPLESVFLDNGFRQGDKNEAEAKAIVERIQNICQDERYKGKSIGVIELQGKDQSELITELLRKKLPPAEFDDRRLICGEPPNFQGDERDVILLSMVVAGNNAGLALTSATYQQRFNVAASRARDQLILFHSIQAADISNLDCVRRKLLEFFQNPAPRQIAGIEIPILEFHAHNDDRQALKPPKPFDSWFEVDVALMIARRRYSIIPQWECAGRKIDLVIVGPHARLAVECDGEFWHGPEQYDKDMLRQRQLERAGWTFVRIRESAFRWDAEKSLEPLWKQLEKLRIQPE